MTTLSIIIVNYKSWEHLGICLDSIQNQKKNKSRNNCIR